MFKFEFTYTGFALAIGLFFFLLVYTYIFRYMRNGKAIHTTSSATNNAITNAKNIITKNNQKKGIIKYKNNYFLPSARKNKNILYLEKNNKNNSIYYNCLCVFEAFLYNQHQNNYFGWEMFYRINSFLIFLNSLWLFAFNMWIIAIVLLLYGLIVMIIFSVSNRKKIKNAQLATIEYLKWQYSNEEDIKILASAVDFHKILYLDIFLISFFDTLNRIAKNFKQWGQYDE
ncbi:hypothetical protein [Mycoplasmopsis lipofaciens]|uniref:hypothetical protein n=1 Tax=Mycoplasmopsis lipofaciens TaxID=114884 RepID=UPI0004821A8B|nr:hypothetical protein [Mycoplasmopsis lipofaciens]